MLFKPSLISFVFIACTLCICFSQKKNTFSLLAEYAAADGLYSRAENLTAAADSDPQKEKLQESLNRNSLALFTKMINGSPALPDSFLFHAYVKAGLLHHFFDSLPGAKEYYLKALSLRPILPAMADSFFFKPALFAGSIYYSLNLFDSANIYYKKAELIADEYKHPPEETERLYNRLGVMYYETGNFIRANDYFQKALSLLSVANPSYRELMVTYKINIASIFVKSEQYLKADTLFRSILPFKINLNEIRHNLAIINIAEGKYTTALTYLRNVNYQNSPKIIDLDFRKAVAFSFLHVPDSVAFYLNSAMADNKRINFNKKNTSAGLVFNFLAEEKLKENYFLAAISDFQQAINEFYPAYRVDDIYSSPDDFTGVFSYLQLFNTLIAKGDAFNALYKNTNNINDLKASFGAYRAAYKLADHVSKTYDSDEARLFMNKIKYAAHDRAIKTGITLYEKSGESIYSEGAFLFDQLNKASALTLSLQEKNIGKESGIPRELYLQQTALRTAITRLSLKALQLMDSATSVKINNEIRDTEIKLSKIQKQISSNPKYAALLAGIQIPGIDKLRAMLDDKTSLLSYHLSENELLIFSLNRKHFNYVIQSIGPNFYKNIQLYIAALHNPDQAQRYNGSAPAAALYQVLIKPILAKIANSSRLVIIPDDELNYIPFEALEDEGKNYLLNSFSVQYQFSTALLHENEIKKTGAIAGFAPFTDDITGSSFQRLLYSREEVADLKGHIFIGREATKQRFLNDANKFRTVQLATHAAANDLNPARSYVAFYPSGKDSSDENILYAQEIYNLQMDSTDLVILTACETGTGKLIRGEGLMSLSRAFAYAGCANIMTSLWKAGDKTTAFISKRLHFYLDKGYAKDIALQRAKTDLLNSNEISPGLKSPAYWAHLIFIGSYESEESAINYFGVAGAFMLIFLLFYLSVKIFRNKYRCTHVVL